MTCQLVKLGFEKVDSFVKITSFPHERENDIKQREKFSIFWLSFPAQEYHPPAIILGVVFLITIEHDELPSSATYPLYQFKQLHSFPDIHVGAMMPVKLFIFPFGK